MPSFFDDQVQSSVPPPRFVSVPAIRPDKASLDVIAPAPEQKQSTDGNTQESACTSRNAFVMRIGAPADGTAPFVITCRYVFSFRTTPPLNEFVEYR